MKILILTKYDLMGASSRERFTIYYESLRKNNIEFEQQYLLPNEYLKRKYAGKRFSVFKLITCYVKRIYSALKAHQYDIIWLQHEVLPYLPFFVEKLLGIYKLPVIVDYDDAIFHNYDQNKNPFIRIFLGSKIKKVIKNSRVAIIGNEYLSDYAKASQAKKIIRIPTIVDTDIYSPTPHNPSNINTIRIGWIGSPSTQKHLDLIKPVIRKLQHELNIEFHVMGVTDDYDASSIATITHEWSSEKQLVFLNRIDIGIMPLIEEPFVKGKCGYKLIQYMAYAKPVVATALGANNKIVRNNVNGFLCHSQNDWYFALKKLCVDSELRMMLGKNGRKIVEEEYSIKTNFPILLSCMTNIYSHSISG